MGLTHGSATTVQALQCTTLHSPVICSRIVHSNCNAWWKLCSKLLQDAPRHTTASVALSHMCVMCVLGVCSVCVCVCVCVYAPQHHHVLVRHSHDEPSQVQLATGTGLPRQKPITTVALYLLPAAFRLPACQQAWKCAPWITHGPGTVCAALVPRRRHA
jgi:hypothetical protein